MSDDKSLNQAGIDDSNAKTTTSDTPEHVEDGSSNAQISYDNNGIAGIIRSPYVFGAALLASFGGFSFTTPYNNLIVVTLVPEKLRNARDTAGDIA